MSFQAYLTNIEAKTGKSPADFRAYAAAKDWLAGETLRPGIKAGTIVADLKAEFALGHGHAMAIVALLKGSKKEGDA
ncbi:hypothetical protein FHS95_004025 [Sphingomonas naasensis]|uniref:DUF4287 domain-containing protein n=1 Tax=Sphingomonas naasensis TaxID=1344951 RepID=A0A4S1WG94_9SPHN|nr:DUF4287 domain-containing protein [Sphingomonas naasensis]NIJ22310.1 hypothetical protein [Sphingomonas naasensis]TGX40687.1 DUF4287 domain-containing protein [Sphingomonas naasensis]